MNVHFLFNEYINNKYYFCSFGLNPSSKYFIGMEQNITVMILELNYSSKIENKDNLNFPVRSVYSEF